jgi:hypothetical protein
MDKKYTGPADPTTPCNQCGGPTYTFSSGSIWCPSEDCEPGGHFVRRVAFERKPASAREAQGRRGALKVVRSKKSESVIKPRDDGFAAGMDAFVKSDDR